MVGAGANRKLTSKVLRQFVDKLSIPFFTTQMGKGVLDEGHPLFLGNAALSDGDFVHRAIDAADLIVNVGHDVVEKPPFFMHADGRTVIHINFSGAEADLVYFPQIEVIGDIANAIWRIGVALEPQPHWDFSFFDRVRQALTAHLAEGATDARFPLVPARVVADVRRVMPRQGILCLDNGMYKIWFARGYPAHQPNTVLLDNALATMGAGLPSAIAAKLVHRDRPVVAVCGDGGLMMSIQELETAVRLGVDLVVLVLRDDGYGMIQWKQQHMGLPRFGLDFGNPDFVKLAEAFGARGHRVERAETLAPTLEAALSSSGVHVIDVPIDYAENHRRLNEELPQRAREVR